jgi:GNAT superfamily N-acetyltransferase
MNIELSSSDLTISTERAKMDVSMVQEFLAKSYWSKGISKAQVCRSMDNSLCFGIFLADRQVGFARVITDKVTYAYIADVFIIAEFRNRGLATKLIDAIVSHPDLQGLRRWMLATRDAHNLYKKFGFKQLNDPGRFMERPMEEHQLFERPDNVI